MLIPLLLETVFDYHTRSNNSIFFDLPSVRSHLRVEAMVMYVRKTNEENDKAHL